MTCSIPFPGEDQWRDIAVVVSPDPGGALSDGEARLLGVARSIADQFGCYVWAVALAPMDEGAAREIISAGADAVEVPSANAAGDVDTLTDRLAAFVSARRPEAVVGAPDPVLHAAMARVAERLKVPFVAAGIALVEDAGSRTLSVRVPRFGGRLLLDLTSPSVRPFFVTVVPASLPPPFPSAGREGEIVSAPPAASQKTSTT